MPAQKPTAPVEAAAAVPNPNLRPRRTKSLFPPPRRRRLRRSAKPPWPTRCQSQGLGERGMGSERANRVGPARTGPEAVVPSTETLKRAESQGVAVGRCVGPVGHGRHRSRPGRRSRRATRWRRSQAAAHEDQQAPRSARLMREFGLDETALTEEDSGQAPPSA